MRFPEKLTKRLTVQIDFGTFRVLEIVPGKAHGSVIFLLPKEHTAHAYCGMYVGEDCHWYGTPEQMLDAAEACGYIGRIEKTILLHRANQINKKQNSVRRKNK